MTSDDPNFRRVSTNTSPLTYSHLTEEKGEIDGGTVRAETALNRSSRTLLRGEAGSGKTTLLRWIAINAARGGFVKDLRDWNGLVPFVVRLRSYPSGQLPGPSQFLDDEASPLAAIAPDGWVHRILSSGRGILLIDGVDELPEKRRLAVRKWLKALLSEYSNLKTIVTSRPAAVDNRWLAVRRFQLGSPSPHDTS